MATVVPVLALLALLMAMVAPRGTAGHYALLALPIIGLAAADGRLRRPLALAPVEIALVLFGGYLAINAAWSVAPLEAYGKVALFIVYAVVGSLAARAIRTLDGDTSARLERAIVLAVGVGAAFLTIETLFDEPIKRTVVSLLPFLRPPKKHMTVENGWVTDINSYVLNRSYGVLSLLLWPSLLLVRTALKAARARLAAGALLAVAALGVFRSEHETSMLALVVACLVYVGMTAAPRVTRGVVLAGWIVATMLIVPIAAASYASGLYQAAWIPSTGRNRIVLWGVTAAKVREAPLLGIGLDSTKPLDEAQGPKAGKPADHPYALRTGRHSHNIFLQTWYELGAVGAVLLLAIGAAVWQALGRLRTDVQPYGFASFASMAMTAAFSWGMWQPWFMAAFAIWAVVLMVALNAQRRGSGAPDAH